MWGLSGKAVTHGGQTGADQAMKGQGTLPKVKRVETGDIYNGE